MAVDHIRYDILAQEALRGVVRTVIEDAATNGLPGDHHFYVTFDTRAEGVQMSPRMRAQYPTEMTVVLQHQFWDLAVTADRFEVGLSFGGVPERLGVPFASIKGFFDPSVQFGLQFEQTTEGATEGATPPAPGETAPLGTGEAVPVARPPAEHKHTRPSPVSIVPTPANPQTPEPGSDGPDKPAGGADVVRLDRFRKK
jgi:hypothetical protein